MAGDWIKMRTCLATDPAVIGIAAAVDVSEFEVVGMLHHLWSWADTQSRDGHAAGVTAKWVNRFCQRDGFAEAMQKAGWLLIEVSGITFPGFSRHNGDSAKARGLAAIRKQKQRSNVTQESPEMSRCERDESATREEKRREEIDQEPAAVVTAPKPKRKTKSSLPSPFLLSTDMAKWARERSPAVDLNLETEKFCNHFRSKGETRADWLATWNNWMLRAQEYAQQRRPGKQAEPNFDDTSWANDLGPL